jgi:hypothetical protein
MSKRQWLCIFGVWVAVFLFLGLPPSWHKIISVITGIVIVSISYNLPHERGSSKSESLSTTEFTESNNINTN